MVAGSALDEHWLDAVDRSRGVLITAQGLLMYLELADVERLLARLSERFRGSTLIFDAVPRWLSEATRKGRVGVGGRYRPPPWLWGLDDDVRRRLGPLEELRLPRGRGVLFGLLVPLAGAARPLRRLYFSILRKRL